MTETEMAIKAIKTAIEDPVGEIAGYAVYAIIEPAVKTALAALEEKAEREKGCEYCLAEKVLAYGIDGMGRIGMIYTDGNLLTADLYSESMAATICFCPKCGRKQEVKQDGR